MSADRHHRGRPGVRLLVVAVIAAATALWAAPAAQAHAFLLGSNPSDGAVLGSSPATLSLDFSESVVVPATILTVTLTSGDGVAVPVGAARSIPTTALAGGEDPVRVTAELPALARGAYQLTWKTLSADDLHSTSGVIVFGVGTAVATAGWGENAPSPYEALLRAVVLAAVAVGVATPVASWVLRRRGRVGQDVDHTLGRVSALVGLAGAFAGLALMVWQLVASSGVVSTILESRYAAWWTVREAGLVLLVVGALAQANVRPGSAPARRLVRALAPVGALVATVATSVLGHSGSGATGSPSRTVVSVVHVLATSCWLGTLALLLLVLARRAPGAARVRAVLVDFAPVAGVSVGLMTATGLALASGVVGSLDSLLLTTYGRLLLTKVLLVAGLLVAGLVTHRRLRRRGPRPMSRLVLAEAAAGVVVLLLTGLVTTGQPALERQLTADPSVPGSVGVSQKVGDLQEELSIRPNLPGQNVAVLRVSDTRRPSPGPVIAVTVTVVDAGGSVVSVPGVPSSDGRWSAPLTLPGWGPVSVRTVVERRGLAPTAGSVSWQVAAPAGTPGPTLSRAPLAPYISGLAWTAFGVLLVGVVVGLRRRLEHDRIRRTRAVRRRGGHPPEPSSPDVSSRPHPSPVGAGPKHT